MQNPITSAIEFSRMVALWIKQQPEKALSFEDVLTEELDEIRKLRLRRIPIYKTEFQGNSSFDKADDAELLGLAFSGGGIRSATFNLGVLQALAECDMLHCFDYLSTVSGGGYIGTWLAAWISRVRRLWPNATMLGVRLVAAFLNPRLRPDDEQVRPIAFLREYSNYLTPRLGLLSADTWTMVSIWLRNSLLNLVILATGGAVILLLPLLLFRLFQALQGLPRGPYRYWFICGGAVLPFLFSGLFVARNLKWFEGRAAEIQKARERVKELRARGGATDAQIQKAEEKVEELRARDNARRQARVTKPEWVRRLIVIPTLISAFSLSALGWNYFRQESSSLRVCVVVGMLFSIYLFMIQLLGGFYGCFNERIPKTLPPFRKSLARLRARLLFVLYPVIAGFIAGGLLILACAKLYAWMGSDWGEWAAMGWGTLLFLAIFAAVVTIHIGLMGRNLPDDRREWWGRLGAWFFVYGIGCAAVVGIGVYGPWALSRFSASFYGNAGLLLTWVGTTAAGILAGRSPLSGIQARGETTGTGKILQLALKIAPTVFVIGMLLILSEVISWALGTLPPPSPVNHWDILGESNASQISHWAHLSQVARSWNPAIACGIAGFVSLMFSWTVDINEFSMHHFYKNRLVRCYLGASRGDKRNPHPATGFDRNDDKRLSSFTHDPNAADTYDGPFPIINTTLNLVKGDNLAWQERKAASFFFTPLSSGYQIFSKENGSAKESDQGIEPNAFRPTKHYAYSNRGIDIGTAMAISGAAANPNMGFHSSPAAAFLMTVFDVRLGWWLGNPRNRTTWQKAGPTVGLGYLIAELLGWTDERGHFVNLSDGGHFDNLGIYELVRRRCHFIVACDAEEDHNLAFAGLGNAIRKCREDFGAAIDINVDQIRRLPETGLSRTHCVVGTITYPDSNEPGTLVYLKASITGDEPVDVLEYRSHHPEFPHQSTADQWFTESQFESYRQLGYHVAERTFRPACARKVPLAAGDHEKKEFFSTLKEFWYPPSVDVEKFFTKHAEAYDALIERIRKDPQLGADLDFNWFPQLENLVAQGDQGRSAFYFCTSLIQLMENVYLDLNLEENFDHPDNSGWKQVFSNWARSGVFRAAWKISHETYGKTFQKWCQEKFKLPSGVP